MSYTPEFNIINSIKNAVDSKLYEKTAFFCFLRECRLRVREILAAVGTDLSQRAVSSLDFELRKGREFQKSSRGVMAKAITPPALRPKFLAPEG